MEFQNKTLNGIEFNIPNYYDLSSFKLIPSGNYSYVVKTKYLPTQKDVVLKKLMFSNTNGQQVNPSDQQLVELTLLKRALREIKILSALKHDCLVSLFDLFSSTDLGDGNEHFYVVMEYAGPNLADYVNLFRVHELRNMANKYNPNYKPETEHFSVKNIRIIMFQIFHGLEYLHSRQIMHRDLKTSNISLESKTGHVRILDVGSARSFNEKNTLNICTFAYVAPELQFDLFGTGCYNEKVDVWSVGCVMAELIRKELLFPNNCSIDLFKKMLRHCGTPSADRIATWSNHTARTLATRHQCPRKNFIDFFRDYIAMDHQHAIDMINFLDSILIVDMNDRPSAKDALEHPFFAGLPTEPQNLDRSPIELNSFDTATREELYEAIRQEISNFKLRLYSL